MLKKLLKYLRNNKIAKFIELNILSYLAWLIINIINSTLKLTRVHYENVKKLGQNVIYAFFHGEQFVLIFAHKHQNVVIMTSFSPDGELQTRILSKFGYDIVRGSAEKKGATSGTLKMIEKISNGQNCAVAVDGPHGPGFKVKPGVIYLAQKTLRPIIPVRIFVKNKIVFKNWDRYILPVPFTNVNIIYGQPLYIRPEDNLQKKTIELENILKQLV